LPAICRVAEPPNSGHNLVPMSKPIVFSWSSGKDSAFGLWTLLADPNFQVTALLTTLNEEHRRVSISGVREEFLDRQASALGLPVIKVLLPTHCDNDTYEARMAATLAGPEFEGVNHVAFADLFLEDIRSYREDRLARVGKSAVFPIWGQDTAKLAARMISEGFCTTVVCVDPRHLDKTFAGRSFDHGFLNDLPATVDPCGENGEFHTAVHDAPMFSQSIPCRTGEVVMRDSFVFCDVIPEVALTD
jgi:uncharacterized protein (TIGR00290 family)